MLLDLKDDSVEGESFYWREQNLLPLVKCSRWNYSMNISFFIILEWESLD